MVPSLSICLRTPTRVTLVTQTQRVRELAVELAAVLAMAVKIAKIVRVIKSRLWCCNSFRLVLLQFATPYLNMRLWKGLYYFLLAIRAIFHADIATSIIRMLVK